MFEPLFEDSFIRQEQRQAPKIKLMINGHNYLQNTSFGYFAS